MGDAGDARRFTGRTSSGRDVALVFSMEEHAGRLARLGAALRGQGLAALLVFAQESHLYLMNAPERQVEFLKLLGSGPANPAASPVLPPELRRINPTYSDNAAKQVIMQDAWYAEHYETVYPRFRDLISS